MGRVHTTLSLRNGSLHMALFGFTSAMAVEPVADRIVVMNISSTLILKACGFIEAYDARILDVTENSLRVRIGNSWYERVLLGSADQKPVEITLVIHNTDPESESQESAMSRPQAPC